LPRKQRVEEWRDGIWRSFKPIPNQGKPLITAWIKPADRVEKREIPSKHDERRN
jgi:hypothetical protein